MKLILENWNEFLNENDSNKTIEGKILKDIQDGKSLEEIKNRFKFSSPQKEKIVERAYNFYNKPIGFKDPPRAAAFTGDPEKAFNYFFGGQKTYRDDKRGIQYHGLGLFGQHGGGINLSHRNDISDVENLEDGNNKTRVFNIIKDENPEFMDFLAYVYLVAGTQNKRMVYKELMKKAEANQDGSRGILGVELRSK